MSLLPFFQWVSTTSLSQAISTSPWAFAVTESMHLLALSVIGGAVLIVDLRLLGLGLRSQSVAQVARDAQRMRGGFSLPHEARVIERRAGARADARGLRGKGCGGNCQGNEDLREVHGVSR